MSKYRFMVIGAGIAFTLFQFLGCENKPDSPPPVSKAESSPKICGGRSIRDDENAPKEVKSSDLSSFELHCGGDTLNGFAEIITQKYDKDYFFKFNDEEHNKAKDRGYVVRLHLNDGLYKQDNKYEADILINKDAMNKIGQAIVDTGILKDNGHYAGTSGISPASGYLDISAEFDFGEFLSYKANGMDLDDSLMKGVTYSIVKELSAIMKEQGDDTDKIDYFVDLYSVK